MCFDTDFAHSILVDENADSSNDLYIRSVCFSPDGKLLATGAEDKTIRVRSRLGVIIPESKSLKIFRALDLGYREEENPQHIPGSHSRDLFARVLVRREVDCLWVWRSHDKDLGYDRRDIKDAGHHGPPRKC